MNPRSADSRLARKTRHAVLTLLGGVLAVAALAACAGPASPPAASGLPGEPPSIRGVITDAAPAGDGGTTVLVVWTDAPAVGAKTDLDAASATITKDTKVFREAADGSIGEAESTDLTPGDIVEMWFTGPVRESYPVQAGASHVLITGRFDGTLPTPPGLEPPVR